MALPPGVTQQNFGKALEEFEAAVGSQWVFTSDDDIALYRDAYSPFQGEPEERLASAAVSPYTVEEVQKVVRTANTYRIPIYPISTGKNLGYGGSAPNLSGSVVLDLKRMNRILEVNEKNASALVEPGVSYFDFYRYIQEHKLKVWMDCPDPGWGSLIGNALDHGGGYTATTFRNHFDAHCGMEVVLATNDKDLFQLVGPCVKVYTTAKADLASPKDAFALLGEEQVRAKWEVSPGLIGDVLALTGDSVDNIPGVGIGRKSAAALIREFGGLEALLNNTDKVKSVRTREKLDNAREQILQNRKMVDLDCEMELPAPIDDLRIKPDYPALIAAMEKCEFKSLLQEVRDEAAKVGTVVQGNLL